MDETSQPKKQRHIAQIVLESILPAKRFSDPALESRFIHDYRDAGRLFAASAFLVGTLMASMTVAVLALGWTHEAPDPPSQYVRSSLIVCMLVTAYLLITRPNFARQHYLLAVGVPMVLCLVSLGAMTLWKSVMIPNLRTNLPVAHTIAVLLAFCFTRLPAMLIAVTALVSSSLLVAGMAIAEPKVVLVIVIYAAVSIAAGWGACIQIERRERALYIQSKALLDLGARLSEKAAEALRASNANKDLIRMVAHDLRQPTASLGLQIKRIEISLERGARVQPSDISGLFACVNYLEGGIERLLADNERRRDSLQLSSVVLDDLIEELLLLFAPKASLSGVELKFSNRGNVGASVLTNRRALGDVLSNAIGNAIKFCRTDVRQRSRVVIHVAYFKEACRIDIIDNGIGIAREHVPLAFELYWRGTSAATSDRFGLGMGLYIAKSLIDRLAGHSIRLDSRLGSGSRIRIYIGVPSTPIRDVAR